MYINYRLFVKLNSPSTIFCFLFFLLSISLPVHIAYCTFKWSINNETEASRSGKRKYKKERKNKTHWGNYEMVIHMEKSSSNIFVIIMGTKNERKRKRKRIIILMCEWLEMVKRIHTVVML